MKNIILFHSKSRKLSQMIRSNKKIEISNRVSWIQRLKARKNSKRNLQKNRSSHWMKMWMKLNPIWASLKNPQKMINSHHLMNFHSILLWEVSFATIHLKATIILLRKLKADSQEEFTQPLPSTAKEVLLPQFKSLNKKFLIKICWMSLRIIMRTHTLKIMSKKINN
jgi:hypothetical protein